MTGRQQAPAPFWWTWLSNSSTAAAEGAEWLSTEFPGCHARPWRFRDGWGVVARHGLSRTGGTPAQTREWLAARNPKAPAGEAAPGASPAGQDERCR